MTYFAFLGYFLGIPLFLLGICTLWDYQRGQQLPNSLRSWSPTIILLCHIGMAVLYTTPWDNYLVATEVWWYDPQLVTGLVLGWVPIEEYSFFVLQTILSGLWLLFLARRVDDGKINHEGRQKRMDSSSRTNSFTASSWKILSVKEIGSTYAYTLRFGSTILIMLLWLVSLLILIVNWTPGTYLALELIWALPPIALQLAVGADILWRYRRLVFWSLIPLTLYLSIGDAIAIESGTWTISPEQSTGILLINLPIEEFIFFLITNILVVFGMILVLARESQERVPPQVLNMIYRLVGKPV